MSKTPILVAVALLLAASACLPMPPLTGPSDAPSVGIIGDSLTVAATEELDVSFADHQRSISAVIGGNTVTSQTTVDQAVAMDLDVIVIALGTNRVEPYVDSMTQTIAKTADENVVWIVPNRNATDVLAAIAGTHVTPARWDLYSAGHPEWSLRGDWTLDVHMTPEGQQAYADFIAGAR